MLQVLLLHIFVVSLAIYFAYVGVEKNRRHVGFKINHAYMVSFLLLFVFLGFRVYLGRDWNNYEGIFTSTFQQDFALGESREIGFLLLVRLLRSFGLEFQSFILVTSFLILFLFYISYRKFYYLLPFGILVFFMDLGYPVVINTIRQGIAIMALLNASLYINSDDKHAIWKFLAFILIGFLFHYTILAFVPFYYIARLKVKLVYFISLCLLIAMVSLLFLMPAYNDTISFVEKYQSYATDDRIVNTNSTFGLGAILVLTLRMAPLLIYENIRKRNPNILKYFVMYYIGLSVYYGFYKFMLITRFTFYLQFFEMFVHAYFIYYMFVKKTSLRLFGVGYVSLFLFNYIYTFQDFLEDQLRTPNFSLMFMDFTSR